MSQKAETSQEICQQEDKQKFSNKNLNFKNFYLSLTVILVIAILTGGLSGLLVSSYYYNNKIITSDLNLNRNIIDFTKKITIDDPNSLMVKNLARQTAGIYNLETTGQWWQKIDLEKRFLGTAVIVTSDGWLLAGPTVITDFKKSYQIITAEGSAYIAKDFYQDSLTGIVFFKIDAANLMPVTFYNQNQLGLNEEIVLMAASGYEATAPVIISHLEKINYYLQTIPKEYYHSTEKQDEFYLTKDLLPENFDGCLAANFRGELIGLGSNNLLENNFQTLIPATYLEQAVDNFLKNKQTVSRANLGLNYFNLSQNLNLPANYTANKRAGALILDYPESNLPAIKKDSPAKDILQSEDIILKVNDDEVNEYNNFTKLIQDYSSNTKIRLTIYRQGQEQDVEIILK